MRGDLLQLVCLHRAPAVITAAPTSALARLSRLRDDRVRVLKAAFGRGVQAQQQVDGRWHVPMPLAEGEAASERRERSRQSQQ